jgi:hypothetical protein
MASGQYSKLACLDRNQWGKDRPRPVLLLVNHCLVRTAPFFAGLPLLPMPLANIFALSALCIVIVPVQPLLSSSFTVLPITEPVTLGLAKPLLVQNTTFSFAYLDCRFSAASTARTRPSAVPRGRVFCENGTSHSERSARGDSNNESFAINHGISRRFVMLKHDKNGRFTPGGIPQMGWFGEIWCVVRTAWDPKAQPTWRSKNEHRQGPVGSHARTINRGVRVQQVGRGVCRRFSMPMRPRSCGAFSGG